jgi:histone H3/H4
MTLSNKTSTTGKAKPQSAAAKPSKQEPKSQSQQEAEPDAASGQDPESEPELDSEPESQAQSDAPAPVQAPMASSRARSTQPKRLHSKELKTQHMKLKRNFDSGWFRRMRYSLRIQMATHDVKLVSAIASQAIANMVVHHAKLVIGNQNRRTITESDIAYAVQTLFKGHRNIATDGEQLNTHSFAPSTVKRKPQALSNNTKALPPKLNTAATTEDMSD